MEATALMFLLLVLRCCMLMLFYLFVRISFTITADTLLSCIVDAIVAHIHLYCADVIFCLQAVASSGCISVVALFFRLRQRGYC
jgi:hypothetical protein